MAALPPHIIVLNNNDSGAGSFRAAVALANSSGNSGITFATNVTGTILLTNGGLVIASSTIINGPGATTLTIDGNANSTVFTVTNGNVYISGLTISNGVNGIVNRAALGINACVIAGNSSGGIQNYTGNLALNSCTVSGNSSTNASSAGILNDSTLAMTNCTVSGNQMTLTFGQALGGGGIANVGGTLALFSCTICSNSVVGSDSTFGGGVFDEGGTMVAGNCVIAGNSATTGPDVLSYSSLSSAGYNLIGMTNSSSGWTNHDLTGSLAAPTNALLGPLQNNGGTTPTHALLAGSPAIDAGYSFGLTTDQRGLLRGVTFSGSLNGGDGSDIGAFEAQAAALTIALLGNSVVISWPSSSTGFVLQQNNSLADPNAWSPYGGAINDDGTTKSATISPPTGNLFFRLKQ